MDTTVRIQGIPVTISGVTYMVPPLNLASLKALETRLTTFKGGVDPESVDVVIECTYAALKRNYPEITKEWVADILDLGNMQDVMTAVMDVSGLKRKAHEASLGETPTS